VIPESAVVTNEAGTQIFQRDVDFVFNNDWGQIGNISSRLGAVGSGKIKATYK
jgi:hypothetical protein